MDAWATTSPQATNETDCRNPLVYTVARRCEGKTVWGILAPEGHPVDNKPLNRNPSPISGGVEGCLLCCLNSSKKRPSPDWVLGLLGTMDVMNTLPNGFGRDRHRRDGWQVGIWTTSRALISLVSFYS